MVNGVERLRPRRAPALHVLCLLALIGAALMSPRSSIAQGTGVSNVLDPSIISAAMGGASTAVSWSAEPNYWANPALLGYYGGVRWQYGSTRLVPDLASDVTFVTKRFTIGAYGVGFEAAGRPFGGPGGLRVDYGSTEITDSGGNPIGTFDGHEDIEASGVGVSVEQLTTALLSIAGAKLPALLQHFDLALGYASKRTEIAFAPDVMASAVSHDHGLFARAGMDAHDVGLGSTPGLTFDASYGHSVLNYDDAQFQFASSSGPTAATRMIWDGAAGRIALDSPAEKHSGDFWLLSLLRAGMHPMFSLGFASDREHVEAAAPPGNPYMSYDVKHYGAELVVLNVLSLRTGHVTDRLGEIDGQTLGLGIALPIGGYAGVRYDFASYPESSTLSNLRRESYSVYFDPLALWRASHEASASH